MTLVNRYSTSQITQWASRQLADYDAHNPGTIFAEGVVLNVVEAYAVRHNHVMRGQRPSAGELIANNAIHAGFVAGAGVNSKEVRGEPSLAIFADDRLLDTCAGPILIETIGSSLKWLTEILRDRGESLGAGQIILTGSIPSLIPIREACHVRVDAPPFGHVEAQIV
jgi:2-keto-4-pentenoate hydratase